MEKLNVAIADDNERMTDILGQMIEEDKELTLVGKAHNGEEICNIIREKEPDVVVLDMIMPKMDGLTVMEQCSHDQTVKKQPAFIVISAVGQERITEDAFNLGASYYMLKPFDNQVLLNRIKHIRKSSIKRFALWHFLLTGECQLQKTIQQRIVQFFHLIQPVIQKIKKKKNKHITTIDLLVVMS